MTVKDHENFIVPQAQQSSDKAIDQPDRNNRDDHYRDQATMENMSLEQRGRMREEPDNQSSGNATAKTAAAASTFRRGGLTSYQDGCNSKPQHPYLGQVRVLLDSVDTSGQETPVLPESGPEPTRSWPGGDNIPEALLYQTTAIPSCYGWCIRRHYGGMWAYPFPEPGDNNIEFVTHDEGTTKVDFQPLPSNPWMDFDPSTTLESSSIPLLQETGAEDTSRVTDAVSRDSPEPGAHLFLEEEPDKPALFAAILPRTTNVIATIRFRLPDADDNIAINFRYADASHEDLDRPKWWKDPDKTSAQHNVNEGELDDEMDRSDEFGGAPLRNAIEDRRRIAAMELYIVRKSHGLPRRYDSSYEMTPDALTLTSESGYLRLFKPEPTTGPVTLHFDVPVLSTQQPETKYPTTRSMSRRKALAIPEPFRTSTTTLPRTRPCVARLARRSRTA
jgi:hypothetical protein